jgi:putative hydrolase of the HAD superfamily
MVEYFQSGDNMNIQAVFFDMGGTIDTYGYTRELRLERTPGIQERLLTAGIDLGLCNEKLYDVVSNGLARYHSWSLESQEELSSACVWGDFILPDYSFDRRALDLIAEDLMCYIETSYYERKMRPEVPAALEAIKQMGLKIGLISNVNSRGQVPTNLTEYRLERYFNPIVLSCGYGRRKPDPAIFHYAARLANVPTSHCAIVGDRISRDILGARRAGFRLAVQIKHNFAHGERDEGATPDFVIEQMTEIIDILRAERQRSSTVLQPAPPSPCSIRALVFDAGDMLYYRAERGKFFTEFLEELGLDSEETYASERYLLRQQAYRGEMDQEEYQREILNLHGITEPEQIARGLKAMKKDENNVQFFDGVKETLLILKDEGYLLAIVTDTANPLHAKLSWFEHGGFGHVWDVITSSLDVGVRKPDPKIYYAALEQLGVTVEQTVFLGHKKSELEGARAVGMKTIAFNYDKDAPADYYVENFADILKVPLFSQQKETL